MQHRLLTMVRDGDAEAAPRRLAAPSLGAAALVMAQGPLPHRHVRPPRLHHVGLTARPHMRQSSADCLSSPVLTASWLVSVRAGPACAPVLGAEGFPPRMHGAGLPGREA